MLNFKCCLWKDWGKWHHWQKSQHNSHQRIRYAEITF